MTTTSARTGGMVTTYHVECTTPGCGERTSDQPSAAHAWADAHHHGWHVPPASWPPLCPTCRPEPVGALFHT